MESNFYHIARMFKAFDDESRLKILSLLRSGEQCAGDLVSKMNISQPTLSHHMRILCDSGVVSSRKDGKWVRYSINPVGRAHLLTLLEEMTRRAAALLEERQDGKTE